MCSAPGGTGATLITYYESYYSKTDIVGQKSGSGGNAGGVGYIRAYNGNSWDGLGGDFAEGDAAYGRSNGAQHTVVSSVARAVLGTSQGTPTVDILGRKHAGGGTAGRVKNGNDKATAFAGGVSDFVSGSGQNGGNARYQEGFSGADVTGEGGLGGGGYGGGGAGGGLAIYSTSDAYTVASGAPGGNGFAIIGWGDYLALYEAQKGAA